MKKTLIKVLSLACATMLAVPFVACGESGTDKDGLITEGKKEIKMSFYLGEFGEWAKDLAIEWSNSNDKYYIKANSNLNLDATISNDVQSGAAYDIYFTENGNYQKIFSGGYLEDLSDVLNSKPDGESGKTVREKIHNYEDWSKISQRGDKVYVLPTNASPVGLIFDYDIFKANNWLMKDSNGNVTVGRDGKAGTYDDGLPQNMEEFQTMCDIIRMKTSNVFLFMGVKAPDYLNNLFYAYLGQTLGEENYEIFLNHESNGKEVEFADGTKSTMTIDEGYKSWQMKGVVDAFSFLQNYFNNTNYVTSTSLTEISTFVDESHTMFIRNNETNAPAFLVEGNWWENGSRELIASHQKYSGGKAYGQSDWRYMLLPASEGERNVVYSQTCGTVIVSKQNDAEKLAAIKDFLRYIYKNDSMSKVTASSGMIWNLDYTLTEEDAQKTSKFAKTAYDIVQDTQNVIIRSQFMDASMVPVNAFSGLQGSVIGMGTNNQGTIFSLLRRSDIAGNPTLALKDMQDNTKKNWATYVNQAKSYGYYND